MTAPNTPFPSIDILKQQAKRLRKGLDEDGDFLTHSESLELIAKQYGFRDWNTLFAAAGNRPAERWFQLGDRVKGRYLGQSFHGEIVAARTMTGEFLQVSVKFDDPVDVVKFDSFSAYRSRITAVINKAGITSAKTSDGEAQLVMQPDDS
ncbi:glyoxalase superfamily protein [Hyphococcus flavus]|uniref:Glyoxalase superfamily protein n=1 Tax=Hyphococcus flavus TaxID=1866326 RepID=A0AAE9ZJQ9_9PROT|nr:glyoxalase superfamily protein [Hyphococcus flavus]WDI32376.1 glyoxalase superfamily protein [Hyphococcus flavus]